MKAFNFYFFIVLILLFAPCTLKATTIVIDDTAYATGRGPLGDVSSGFTIPSKTTVQWAVTTPATQPVTGTIKWADSTASLNLASDLYLDGKASLAGTASIDAQGNTIKLNTDVSLDPISSISTTGIGIISDLIIDGQGHTFTWNSFLRFLSNDKQEHTFTLKNTTLVVNQYLPESCPIFFTKNHNILDNVTLLCPKQAKVASIGCDCKITIRNLVSIGATGQHILLALSQNNFPVTIESNGILQINPGVNFITGQAKKSSSLITMTDATSKLLLDGCNFYTGSRGLTLETGMLEYNNAVSIYNGDYTNPFVANTDPNYALVLASSLNEVTNGGASATVYGLKIKETEDITIDNSNVATYMNGFTIPSGTTYSWNSTTTLSGPIIFTDSTSTLQLYANLVLDAQAALFSTNGTIANSGTLTYNNFRITQLIEDGANAAGYTSGFTIPINTTYVLNTSQTITGPIYWQDATACMQLDSSLTLGSITLQNNTQNYLPIDGNGNTITLTGNATIDNGALPAGIMILSDLVIDGQGYTFSWNDFIHCMSTDGIFVIAGRAKNLTIKNTILSITANDPFAPIFVNDNLVFDDVTVTCPADASLLGLSPLMIRNTVSFGDTGQRIVMARYATHTPVTIGSNGTLSVSSGADFEAGDTQAAYVGGIDFTMTDTSSTLHLDNCNFYTGAEGLIIKNGIVSYENNVTIFNGNYTDPFEANTVPANGLILVDVAENYIGGATLTVHGIKLDAAIIDDSNSNSYINGFTIPADSVYVWDSTATVNGPITFTDGVSLLLLAQNLRINDASYIAQEAYKEIIAQHFTITDASQSDTILMQGIDNVNSSSFIGGFTVPANTVYSWRCFQNMDGLIYFEDASSFLQLSANLLIPQAGFIAEANFKQVWPRFFEIIDMLNDQTVILQGINESNINRYINGFTIPTNTTFVLDITEDINGPIIWTDPSSVLQCNNNLYLGANASFVPGTGSAIVFSGLGKTVFIDEILTLKDCAFYSGNDGITFSGDTIKFSGTVQLFNGDYANPFVPNSDPAKGIFFDTGLIQLCDSGSGVIEYGVVSGSTAPLKSNTAFSSNSAKITIGNGCRMNVANNFILTRGTLQQASNSQLTGPAILIQDAQIQQNNKIMQITGQIESEGFTSFTGYGDTTLDLMTTSSIQKITLSGSNNLITGSPLFFGTDALTLFDNQTTVSLALHTPLNGNIVLQGGSVFLESDLNFGDNGNFSGSGILALNNNRLSLGGKSLAWTATMHIMQGNDIEMNSDIKLSGMLIFDGDAQVNGNGNTLDLTLGGTIRVKPNSSVHFTNIILKGISVYDPYGHETAGNMLFDDGTAQMRFSQSELGMDSDYTLTTGGMYIAGATIINVKDHFLTFDQVASLTVDGTSLTYDTLTYLDQSNIIGTASYNINTINDGIIRTISGETQTQNSYTFSSNTTLNDPIFLNDLKKMYITGSLVLDGNNSLIYFGSSDQQLLIIDAGCTLELKNITLMDFGVNHVELGSGAHIIFGDGTSIQFSKNQALPASSLGSLYFTGNTELHGYGQYLDLSSTSSITIGGSASTLLIDGLTIKNLCGTTLQMLDEDSIIQLQNSTLKLSGNYTFTTGAFDIIGDTKIMGSGHTFGMETTMTTSIRSKSMLTIDRGTTLKYAPASSDRNDLIWQPDETSVLFLNGASLVTTTTGLQLTRGSLLIDGKVSFYNDDATSLSEAIGFGDHQEGHDVAVNIMPGASINLMSGLIDYRNVD